MEVKITFTYLNKTITALCKDELEINKMYELFTNKLNDGSEPSHYYYYCNGNKLGHDSTICKNKYLAGKKDLNITVQKKLRIIKCPKCKCNDCIVNLDDYKLSFYGCKYNHSYTAVYDEYINVQKLDNTEIRCSAPECQHNQENYTQGLYKCLNCSKLVKRSKYYCKDHLKDHEKHITVKYDKKNYFCVKHYKRYIKYCFTHKENLCEDCACEHEGDKVKVYDVMVPNIEKLKQSLSLMEENINNLKTIIEDVKSRLDGTLRIFRRYLYIAKDIIGKFELFNKDLKNYNILKSLRNLKFSNYRINNDLNKILEEDEEIKKINSIIKIYEDKEENYRKNINENYDYSKDNNDDDWLEDIQKKEMNNNFGQIKKNNKNIRVKK